MNYSHLTLCLIYSTSKTMKMTIIVTERTERITATTLPAMTPPWLLLLIEKKAAMRT